MNNVLRHGLLLLIMLLCVWIVGSQDQCSSDISLTIGVTYNSIYKTTIPFFVANASLYGKINSFNYDGSQVKTSNAEVVTKLKSGVALAIAEVPPTNDALDDAKNFLSIPVLAGSLIFYFNLANITDLILTPQVIAEIYLGNIVRWNDTAIQNLNPQLGLPDKKIVVTAEYAENAGTDLLGWSLSIYSDNWKKRFGNNKWQQVMNYTYFPSALSMLRFISQTPNSIGFTALENTLSGTNGLTNPQALTNVSILNSNGFAVPMTSKNVAATLRSMPKQSFSDSDSLAYLMKNSVSTTYPFVYFEYMVVSRSNTQNNSISCCAMVEVVAFIDYFLDSIKNATSTKYGFFTFSTEVVQHLRENVFPLIMCNGSSTYSNYLLSRTVMVQSQQQEAMVQTWQIVVPIAVAVLVFMVSFIAGYILYQKHLKLSNENLWKIDESEITLMESQQKIGLSEMSLGACQSTQASMNNQSNMRNYMVMVGNFKRNDVLVSLTELKFENFSSWQQTTKRLIYRFTRDINHQNICSLFGVTSIQTKPCLVSQFCHKGTLNYVLEFCPFDLLLDIKYSLANNILNGLKYLHSKLIIHGSLSSLTCFVDETWCVKIANWALFSISSKEPTKARQTARGSETNGTTLSQDESESSTELIKFLYSDPDASFSEQPTKASDIYSFGMLLVEIFTRQLPYHEEVEMCQTTYAEIIRKKLKKVECMPRLPNDVPQNMHPLIHKLVGWSESRPDITTVASEMSRLCGNNKKNVVDVMMKLMEKHMEDLEEKVIERTSELVNITNRMKELLNEMLPPQIAEKFIAGVTVEPESYECATIFFLDIVGFTTISARSTPYQVMNLLNELWKLFDGTIEKFDVYKVDTIGDAYMVASGLPTRNGIDHCAQIANFALLILAESKSFAISHLPGEMVRVRMGINSGPVTAGIVGHKMPQYCIFGDTVNTASRMESSSLPMKIHVSEFSRGLFESYFPEFIFELRGEIEVKGKGTMKTYWLVDSFKYKV